jgi:G:T-mismatch repair DNA endonuclease (very short patch repair protein)
MSYFTSLCAKVKAAVFKNGKYEGRKWKAHKQLREEISSWQHRELQTIDEKLFALRTGNEKRPVCAVCSAPVRLKSQVAGWRRTCSLKCAANDEDTKTKTATTLKERFGKHHTQNEEWVTSFVKQQKLNGSYEKGIKTFHEKYGVSNQFAREEVKDKIKQTNISRYGAENPQQVKAIRDKTQQTCIEKYGRTSGFIARSGDENAMTSYATVFKGCTTKLSKLSWNDIEKDKKFSYISICGDEHIFTCLLCDKTSSVGSLMATCQCREKTLEKQIADFVSGLGISTKRRDRKVLNGLELDIFCPDKKLAIELNGVYWHGENVLSKRVASAKSYHRNKYEMCKEAGIKLLQFTDLEWKNKQELVKSMIAQRLGVSEKIGARRCSIVTISGSSARVFLQSNHISGATGASLHKGLEKDGKLLMLASFGKNRFGEGHELVRMCSVKGVTVVGGAARLVAAGMEELSITKLTSYCDLRYGDGAVYEKLGFFNSSTGSPGYWYINPSRNEVCSRQKFQKHKLPTKLENFDSNLSEWENMQANGYDRLWDAGHSKWVLSA